MSRDEKREEIPPPPIPNGCKPLSHQVAGHVYGKCKTRAGLLQDNCGSILKLLQTNNRGNREKKFYKRVFNEEQDDPILLNVRDLVCPFRGTVVSTEDPSVEFIKLRDMTIGYEHPCIMDIKIGRIGYAEEGGDSKKAEMSRLKYPDMEKLGFQILGMRVYHPQSQKYTIYDKKYGKTLNINSMIEGLAKFFNVDETIRTDVMYAFLVRLQQILEWFQVQTRYHFYSSSLLFIYEGTLPPGDDELKKPSKHAHHSTMPTSPMNGNVFEMFSVKPDTYPLKRKKSMDINNDEDNDDISGIGRGSKNHRENGVRRAGERDDRRVNDVSSHTIANDSLGREMMHNDVKDRVESEPETVVNHVQGIAPGTGSSSPSQRRRHSHSSPEKAVIGDKFPPDSHNHHHFPTPNHSTHEPNISTCTNHNNDHNSDHNSLQEASHKDSHPPHENTTNHVPHPVEIRMIDFAHAIETTTRDENYIFGLKMLRQYIETLHNCFVW